MKQREAEFGPPIIILRRWYRRVEDDSSSRRGRRGPGSRPRLEVLWFVGGGGVALGAVVVLGVALALAAMAAWGVRGQ